MFRDIKTERKLEKGTVNRDNSSIIRMYFNKT